MIRFIKLLHAITWLIATLQEGGMKNWTGIIKVLTYVLAAVSLIFGYLPASLVLTITLFVSAAAKIAEIIFGLTPSTQDDAKVAEIIALLKKNGIIK
jgi:hypothetical protein